MTRVEKLSQLKQIIDGDIHRANVNTLLELNNYFVPTHKITCGCKSNRIIQQLNNFWSSIGNNEYLQSVSNEEN